MENSNKLTCYFQRFYLKVYLITPGQSFQDFILLYYLYCILLARVSKIFAQQLYLVMSFDPFRVMRHHLQTCTQRSYEQEERITVHFEPT